MISRLLASLLCLVSAFAYGVAGSQEIPRNLRWSEDLDYLVQRLEITHPNLYANISREAFHRYADQLKERIPAASDVEMAFGVQELLARIRNAHTLSMPMMFYDGNPELAAQLRYYPVFYYPFDDGLYVTATGENYQAILGKKVVKLGKLTVEEAMRSLARFVAADNEMTVLANIPRFFLNDGQLLRLVGASDSSEHMTLRLEDGDGTVFDSEIRTDPEFRTGGIQWHTMDAASGNPPPLYRTHPRENYWFQHLPEQKAIYLQINRMNHIQSEPFPEFCRRLFDALDESNAEKLIIDVRGCSGGDHIERPLLKGILARPRIDQADRLFLIIGRMTGSAAEHLTAELERYTNATLFGEATCSKPNQYGAMQRFFLPHSRLEIASASKYFQDAEPSDYSIASKPLVHVPRVSRDRKENRDPIMEHILSFDTYKHLREDFHASLTDAYAAAGLDGFRKAYESAKAKVTEMGFDMETLLYRDLDAWMGQNKKSDDDYFEFLKFIHREVPDSVAITYDLAYWTNERGDREEAKRLFEECLVLNPEHHHARWRLELIRMEEAREAEAG